MFNLCRAYFIISTFCLLNPRLNPRVSRYPQKRNRSITRKYAITGNSIIQPHK